MSKTARKWLQCSAVVALWVLLQVSACSPYSSTTRVLDGRTVEGRPITAEAYAAYLSAARREARGELEAAIAEYRVALDHDPDSVEIRTRIAHLVCKTAYIEGLEEFEAALDLDASYEPAWRLGARCALEHDDPGRALTWARQSVAVAPLELSASAVLADALFVRGQQDAGVRLLLAYATRFPHDQQAQLVLQRHLELAKAPSGAPDAGQDRVSAVSAVLPSGEKAQRGVARGRVRVTVADDGLLSRARAALAAGESVEALRVAQLVWRADPQNSDARILVLVAADRCGEDAAFLQALSQWSTPLTSPSPAAAQALSNLLRFRVGVEASTAFGAALMRCGGTSPCPEPAARSALPTGAADPPNSQPTGSEPHGRASAPAGDPVSE